MVKVPLGNGLEDYDPDDPDIEFRKKRWDYWGTLKKIRVEYMATLDQLQGQFDAYEFEEYVEKNYGIKMNMIDGRITDKFEVVDEKLYTYFLLKWE